MEDYPSPAEGNGLENRQAGKTVQGFESLILLSIIAEWRSWHLVGLITRRSQVRVLPPQFCGCSLVVKPQPSKLLSRVRFSSPAFSFYGPIAQLVRAHA